MSRLKKNLVKIAKPRPKKKELVLTYKFTLEVFNDNEDEAKADIKRFKQWMKDSFVHWPDSMLQHFLYAYNLHQDHTDSKYLLEGHIDKVLKDESVTIDERTSFDDLLVQVDDDADAKRQQMEDELFIEEQPETFDVRDDKKPKKLLDPDKLQQAKDKIKGAN